MTDTTLTTPLVVVEVIETSGPATTLIEQDLQTEVLEVSTPTLAEVEVLEVRGESEVLLEQEQATEILEVAEQGPPGRDSDVYFEKVLGAVTDVMVLTSEHLLPSVRTATLFTPGGDEVSISINVSNGNVAVSSNVSLANHRLVIF